MTMRNIYQPDLMQVIETRQQTPDVKSVKVKFLDGARANEFSFRVGQFGIFSVFGYGEATFNICSSSNWKDYLEFCFRRVGCVTEALWSIEEGDVIGFRGPYGNAYPTEEWKGKNLIFLGGGIAMPPVRCAVWYALENRADYGNITIVYGARTVADLVYVDELTPGPSTPTCAWCAASIRVERRPTGRVRSGSCLPSSSAPACRRKTQSRSSSAHPS